MGPIFIIMGIALGIVAFGFMIVLKAKKSIGNLLGESDLKLLKDMIKNREYETSDEAYSRDKSIGGMTSIYESQIREDFPDFNLSLLFNNIEKNIRTILNAKTELDTSLFDDEQLILIKNNVKKEIEDFKLNGIKVSYKDVIFNQHVIKRYAKKNGTATITTASQVKYYYDSNKKEEKHHNIKKSTVYICDFIYVYDEAKFEQEEKTIAINCPNCGAPVTGLDGGNCSYCGTYVKPINLKAWKMASYKEDIRN